MTRHEGKIIAYVVRPEKLVSARTSDALKHHYPSILIIILTKIQRARRDRERERGGTLIGLTVLSI